MFVRHGIFDTRCEIRTVAFASEPILLVRGVECSAPACAQKKGENTSF